MPSNPTLPEDVIKEALTLMREASRSAWPPTDGQRLDAIAPLIIEWARKDAFSGLPDGNFRPRFQPGDLVEAVSGGYGGNSGEIRPGVVSAIDDEPRVHHLLRVRFDDGEECQVNPDVMRKRPTPETTGGKTK